MDADFWNTRYARDDFVYGTEPNDFVAEVAARIPPGSAATFLGRAARAAELLASNVSPELILDSLVLAWPGRARAA